MSTGTPASLAACFGSPSAAGSMAISAFTLSGCFWAMSKPNLPAWLCTRITQGQTFSISWL